MIETDDSQSSTAGFQYQWMVNGDPLRDQTGPTLTPSMLKRGDRVTVGIVPTSGTIKGDSLPGGPRVGRQYPPVVGSFSIERPDEPHAPVFANMEAVDADQDEIQFDFRWWRNDKVVKLGPEQTLDTTGFQTKDTLEVEVTPRDQLSAGKRFVLNRSMSAIALRRSSLPGSHRPRTIRVSVEAVDADGDSLSFLLEAAPPGMAIDKETGHLVWQIPPDQLGSHRVRSSLKTVKGEKPFRNSISPSLLPASLLNPKARESAWPRHSFFCLSLQSTVC